MHQGARGQADCTTLPGCGTGSQIFLPFPGLAKPPWPGGFLPGGVASQETQCGADPGASLVQGEPGQGASAQRQRGSPEPAVGSVGHCCPLALQTLAKGKVISTDHLKLFLSRRKWQVKAGAGAGGGQADLCAGQDDAMPPAWV